MTSLIRVYLAPSFYSPHASIARPKLVTLFLFLFRSPFPYNFQSTFLPILSTNLTNSLSCHRITYACI
ncbi:hypothetical protein EYC80_005843 [Monilinia laxa]|uniref:Uncharacterized protein n=1 Tax=Monilinia laxa TaxID=61186 RepID=A0A5N6KGP5_MONLA|nr:hypothetical protein EYC80_005843 [Monilinia laxa]